ncbi:MAG TPA: ATP-binding protein [Gemmatimonadota bacterium]|nr:ATP-binding protein [Gemmatimonadota bacterium]
MRLRHRIFLTYLGVATILVAAGGAILYRALMDEAWAGIEARLSIGVRLVTAMLEAPGAPGSPGELDARVDALLDALAAPPGTRFTVVGPDGRVLADSGFDGPALEALDDHSRRPEVAGARAAGESGSVRYSRSVESDLVYRARRIERGPWAGSVVRMAVPADRIAAARTTALGRVALGLGAGLALALSAGAFWARRLARPIGELAATAGRVAAGDLEARARVDTRDELEDLAAAVNAASARLADRIHASTAERDRLEAVLDGMAEGVLVTDAGGRIVRANPALAVMFGLEREPVGRTVIEALRHAAAAEAMGRAAIDRAAVTGEVRLTWPAERTLTLHAAGLGGGGAVGVFHDVTELDRAEEVRRDFVSNVSHEIRTPLAAIAGYAEALSEPGVGPEEARGHAEVIARQVERLTALVDDLLRLSRLEAAGFEPLVEDVDAGALAASVGAEWRSRFEAAGIGLEVRVEPGLDVRGEPGLLRQALENLLDNALKYCPPGSTIRLEAGREGGDVTLTVSDDGPGIPREAQPRIFERFYRVEKGRARPGGGTGLGLAIVKQIVEAHGGSVAVESAPGRGTAFRITLFAPAPA